MIARFVFKSIPALFTAGVLVIVLQGVDMSPRFGGLMQTANGIWEKLTTAPQVTTDAEAEVNVVSVQALVTAMQGLNRWETQGATVTGCATVDNNETNHFYSYFVGETLELCGTGTVIAGVDMSTFSDTLSIKNDGRTVDVRVPDAQVFFADGRSITDAPSVGEPWLVCAGQERDTQPNRTNRSPRSHVIGGM